MLEAAPRNGDVSDESTQALTARLALEGRPLGQFVSDSALPSVYRKERGRTALNLAHNWDLLRQSAEKNGLYFEPLASGGNAPAHAILWISRDQLNRRAPCPFDAKLLNIEDPRRDGQLRDWRGYTETRYLDEAGVWTQNAEPGAQAVEMIPLALYSLDYPRTPLLLVDFRHRSGPKRHELLRRASSTVAGAVFGVTPWNSWAYFAGSTSWNFVTGRHGAAIDRGLRLRAYARCREYLLLDDSLAPQLRDELRGRLKTLEFNPLDNGSEHESEVAWQQYRALLLYAEDPGGLTRRTRGRSSASPHADAASGF